MLQIVYTVPMTAEDAKTYSYRAAVPIRRACPVVAPPFALSEADTWNCNLCGADMPFFAPFLRGDIMPLQTNFADAFKLFSCGYYQQTIESIANGIAIGVIYYEANSRAESGLKGGHAINIIYIDNGKNNDRTNNFYPIFIEPQNGKIYKLTQEEFNSISTVYI